MPLSELAAIIPASGKGGRFGQPKAQAQYDGKAFAEHISATLREAGINSVVIAAGYDTPDMLATLRKALLELDSQPVQGWLVWPVDHPFVLPETVSALCEAWLANRDAVLRPSYQSRTGHPIIIPAWLDLYADDGGQGLAGLIRSQACTVIDLPVDDEAVLCNINYPQDLDS